MRYFSTIETPLGKIVASAENEALTGLWFWGQKYFPKIDNWVEKAEYPVFEALRLWITDYFNGKNPAITLRLDPQGSPFQKSVWKILLEIPYGQLSTYGKISRQLASGQNLSRMSARAVGGAVGHNPISLLIPCHRVVGANGSLTGYAGGIDKKEALLRLEGAIFGATGAETKKIYMVDY
jgi:methylated-DNA-[protein]-cysteine S-methyltransferase